MSSVNEQGNQLNKSYNNELYDCKTFNPERKNSRLYNEDLAPLQPEDRNWGWFSIFNVWSNDIQSLFGYTLA